MARPKIEFPPAAAILALADDRGRIALRATPGARQEAIAIAQGRLQVRVRARAQDGAANEAVRALLAKALGIAGSRLYLLRGATSREKVFEISAD